MAKRGSKYEVHTFSLLQMFWLGYTVRYVAHINFSKYQNAIAS